VVILTRQEKIGLILAKIIEFDFLKHQFIIV